MLTIFEAVRRFNAALPKLPPKPEPAPAQPRIDADYLRLLFEKEPT